MSELSRRAALAAGAGALVAGSAAPTVVAASGSAKVGQTRVAARYAEYLVAKDYAAAQEAAYAAAAARFAAMRPTVPPDIVKPNSLLRDGIIHWASQDAIFISEHRYRYAAQPLRDLVDYYTGVPDRVRGEAKRILPLVEAYEAAEAQARANSGYARFTDSGVVDQAIDQKFDAESAVYAEPAETAEDLVLKGRVLQDFIELDAVSDGDIERFVDEVVMFLSNGTSNV